MSYKLFTPHEGPQRAFLESGCSEVFYGGAAGGGKSLALIFDALRYVYHPTYRGLILRRTFPQLSEIIDRTRRYYPIAVPGAFYKASEHVWVFPSGSRIRLGHMQTEGSEYNYQGQDFQYVGYDEATQFEGRMYLYLLSRLRTDDSAIRPVLRATGNPGGVGHQFFRDRFRIGHTPPGTPIIEETVFPDTGEIRKTSRVFIAASIYDNPTLMRSDPSYVERLMQLPEVEKQRLLYGCWDAFEGQYFHELSDAVHGTDMSPQEVPPEWERFRSYDFGYAKPYCVLWVAVDYDGRMWVYDEIYGAKEGETDVGLRHTATEISRRIKEREREHNGPRVKIGPADPSIWGPQVKKDGVRGPSVADEMAQEGIHWIKADNQRIGGWQQLHERLRVDEEGRPMLYISRRCKSLWRTLPLLREYKGNPEDIDTKTEDHPADTLRYACMQSPLKPKHRASDDAGSFRAERRRMIKAKEHSTRYGVSLSEAYTRVR